MTAGSDKSSLKIKVTALVLFFVTCTTYSTKNEPWRANGIFRGVGMGMGAKQRATVSAVSIHKQTIWKILTNMRSS